MLEVGWSHAGTDALTTTTNPAVVLIHGFGANTDHWRHTMPALSAQTPTYALDLIGFGRSSQPQALLKGEPSTTATQDGLHYSFDLWGEQVASFCRQVVNRPVLLVGNSIGGVVALRAAQLLDANPDGSNCKGVVLIDTPGHNPSAKTITMAKGFKPMASTVRMYKGVIPKGHDRNIYGLACLELG